MTVSTDDVDPLKPQPRADLSVFQLDDELVVYDPRNGESYILNQTGRLVWERCDGKRMAAEIASEIAELHGISDEQASADTAELLATFKRANLLNN